MQSIGFGTKYCCDPVFANFLIEFDFSHCACGPTNQFRQHWKSEIVIALHYLYIELVLALEGVFHHLVHLNICIISRFLLIHRFIFSCDS